MASIFLASPANAASGRGLDGTDPASTGCANGSVSIDYQNLYIHGNGPWIGAVDVRYSPSCGTNWIRVYNASGVYDGHSDKYILRPQQGGLPVFKQLEVDPGAGALGWTYGMQTYAPGTTTICYQGGISTSAWTAHSQYRCISY